MKKRNPISASRADDLVKQRLGALREEVRSGATEMVGKTYRGASGKVEGRFKGGFGKLYPEVTRSGLTPGQAAKAVERGKGIRYRRLARASREEIDREYGPIGRRIYKRKSRGRPVIAAHSGKKYCSHCRVMHSKDSHRFHGPGAFHQTHLFSFNPRWKPKRIYGWKCPTCGKTLMMRKAITRHVLSHKKRLKNPQKLVKIYEKVLRIEAQKGPGHRCDAACRRAGHRYYHVFKTKPRMFGLADGSLLIKS